MTARDPVTTKYPAWPYLAIAVVATAAAFPPSLFNNFVLWDDPYYVLDNLLLKNFSLKNTAVIFTRAFQGCYCPLTILSYVPEYKLFHLNPFPYHLTNYLLHIGITILVFYFIRLISSSHKAAFIVALFFGIHPLHVESVAWIAERKDLLCAIFYMAALLVYIRFIKEKRPLDYVICFLAALLALLAKPMAVTIPFALLLLDFFFLSRIDIKSVIDKTPFFIISAIFGIINIHFQTLAGAMKFSGDLGVKTYFFAKTIPFYLYKMLLPVNLSILYPYHNVRQVHLQALPYYFVALFLLVVFTVLAFRFSKRVTFGILFFLITISPVLKIIPAGDTFAADRYMYLPSIGLLYIFAVYCENLLNSRMAKKEAVRNAMIFVFAVAAAWFSLLTWQRCLIWKDTESLFAHVMKRYPNEPSPYNNLGVFYEQKGDLDKAMKYFKMAAAIDPQNQSAADNIERADLLIRGRKTPAPPAALPAAMTAGTPSEATAAAVPAAGIEEARTLNALGVEKGKAGRLDEAIALFNKALEFEPDYADTYNNLGFAYYKKGELDRAEEYFKKALDIDPGYEKARINLKAIAKVKEGL